MQSRTGGMWWGTSIEAGWPPAVLADFQPQPDVRVLDPAGHPSCLCLDEDSQ